MALASRAPIMRSTRILCILQTICLFCNVPLTSSSRNHNPFHLCRPSAKRQVIMNILVSVCATNTSVPIVIVNNHNHSEISTDPITSETLAFEFTTGPAITLSTGSITSNDSAHANSTALHYATSLDSPFPSGPNGTFGQPVLTVATISPPSPSKAPASEEPMHTSGSAPHPRWVDYRSRPSPAFPPRVPSVHGIPSGFRNPAVTPPYGMHASASAPQHPHAFGPSSSNPVGFAGSVPAAPASFPASNANQDRRRPSANLTRVERE